MRALFTCAFAIMLAASSAHARPPKDADLAFIQTLYDNYLAEQNDDDASHIDGLDQIERRASTSLKKALRLENQCVIKTKEVCAIDADIIINAQDWMLSDVKVSMLSPEKDGEKTIRADFKNMERKTQVDYFFILEKGAWKIDEIEARDFNDDGTVKPDYSWRLKESIIIRLKEINFTRAMFLKRAEI